MPRGLTTVYGSGESAVRALRDVDLDVFPGEFLVLLGPSGIGKSTLVNILGGLDAATSGSVTFLDHDLTVDDDAALTRYRRDHVGFVFQFYNLLPNLTARENVAIVTRSRPSHGSRGRTSPRWPRRPVGSVSISEVVISDAFAGANGLPVGSRFGAIVNGRWQTLRVVGTAVSPEYVYSLRGAGEVFPDSLGTSASSGWARRRSRPRSG